jgi:hypothetical protein
MPPQAVAIDRPVANVMRASENTGPRYVEMPRVPPIGKPSGGLDRRFETRDLDAWSKQSEIREEGTDPRVTHRTERRRECLPGSAAHGDALADVRNPPLAGQRQSNGETAQREGDRVAIAAHRATMRAVCDS